MNFDTMLDVTKEAVFGALLQEGSVFVTLNTNYWDYSDTELSVPDHLEGTITLQLGYDLEPAIPDLAYSDTCVSGTLTFKGKQHFVVIPWECITSIVGANTWEKAKVVKKPTLRLVK